MTAVRIQNVVKSFGPRTVLNNVFLEIRSGELFFLLGPSGCGKTTLLRILAGFEQADSGDIQFDDRSVIATAAHRRNIGMVFQHYALWPHLTVEQNVSYGLDERNITHHEKTQRVQRILERVRMQDYATRFPNQLSGGQQQRVALARALVIEPSVVLLDEPLSNLDASLRADMRDEIRSLHEETGVTMLYVTHDQQEALSMATTVAVMSEGRVEQLGSPSDIYDKPANRFVADFLGAANWIPGVVQNTNGTRASVQTGNGVIQGTLSDSRLPAGTAVECMIRPENLVIQSDPGENTFEATIIRTTFLGASTEAHVNTAFGIMRIHGPSHFFHSLHPGPLIHIHCPPDATMVLPLQKS